MNPEETASVKNRRTHFVTNRMKSFEFSPERGKGVKMPARKLREVLSPNQGGDRLAVVEDELPLVPPAFSANKSLAVGIRTSSNGTSCDSLDLTSARKYHQLLSENFPVSNKSELSKVPRIPLDKTEENNTQNELKACLFLRR